MNVAQELLHLQSCSADVKDERYSPPNYGSTQPRLNTHALCPITFSFIDYIHSVKQLRSKGYGVA